MNARSLLRMVCARKRQAKEGSHAFTEAFYRFRHRGSSMGVAAPLGCAAAQEGSRAPLHGDRRLERRAVRRGTLDLDLRRLSRPQRRAIATSGLRCPGRRPAAHLAGSGKSSQPSIDRRAAAPYAAPDVAGGDRLALGALLRRAAAQPQRNLLRQAQAGHLAFPRVCHRLHCAVRRAVHVGADVGAPPRKHRRRLAASVGAGFAKSA